MYPRRVNDVMEIVRGRICGKVVEKRIGWEGWKGDVSIIG